MIRYKTNVTDFSWKDLPSKRSLLTMSFSIGVGDINPTDELMMLKSLTNKFKGVDFIRCKKDEGEVILFTLKKIEDIQLWKERCKAETRLKEQASRINAYKRQILKSLKNGSTKKTNQ